MIGLDSSRFEWKRQLPSSGTIFQHSKSGRMSSEITFSLLNFSVPAENGSLKTKPSASKFSKLSSSKKQHSLSKKENIELKGNSSSKVVAKNLLSTYSDKAKDNPINGVLKERNNVFDNSANACKVKNDFNNTTSMEVADRNGANHSDKASKEKPNIPLASVFDCLKFNTYQEIIDHSKKNFVKTNANGNHRKDSGENLSLQKKQIKDESNGKATILKNSNSYNSGQEFDGASACSRNGNEKLKNQLIKSNSLSTSFSSLDNSVPKILKSGNKLAPKKLSESIISISSSPESNEKSLYESLPSFFPEKYCKVSKKLISSTPRCSEVFYSPSNISCDFESVNFSLSKINSDVSKASSINCPTKDSKNNSDSMSGKTDANLTEPNKTKSSSSETNSGKNRNNFSNDTVDQFESLKNSSEDADSSRKISGLSKSIDNRLNASNKLSVKINATCSLGATSGSCTNGCITHTNCGNKYVSSKNSSAKMDSSEVAFDELQGPLMDSNQSNKFSNRSSSKENKFGAGINSYSKPSNNLIDATNSSEATSGSMVESRLAPKFSRNKKATSKTTSTKFNSSEDAFDKLRSTLVDFNSEFQTSKDDNVSQRFKDSDAPRVIFDTLKFRGITIRRHRRQKVLGLQKDFMYEETSSDSDEKECNDENICPDNDQKIHTDISNRRSFNDFKSSNLVDDSLSSIRKVEKKQLLESSKSSSENSSQSYLNCSNDSESSKKSSHGKTSRSNISKSLRSSDSSFNDRNEKSRLKQSGNSKLSTKSSSSYIIKGLGACHIRGDSFENKADSCSDVSKSDSVLEAEKLLNELYGTTWHDKKELILPRSSVKKKITKEKPNKVNRQTLHFSSDESNSNQDVFKPKVLRKKKPNSFINDDSSPSEFEDLNFYRTLSNKLSSSSSKPKVGSRVRTLSSSSEDFFNSVTRKRNSQLSESSDTLNLSLESKNIGKNQSGRKGKLKRSPTFIARKNNTLTATLSDNKFKKPSVKKTSKVIPSADKTFELSSDSELDSDSSKSSLTKHSAPGRSKKNIKPIVNTPLKPIPKKYKISTPKTPGKEPRLSFLASLSATADESRAHPDAIPYKKLYKSKKEELARRLLILYNKEVFESRLPDDMLLQWNARMRSTSGYCYNKKVRRTGIEMARVSRIVLSTKILDTPERLRDTLLHELCHAAAWVINGTADGHGPLWKSWANKAMRRFPEVPPVKRCHDYSIKTKFTYRCTSCGYSLGRHSKSLDITRKRCGYCYGAFELLVNHSKSNRKSAENLKAPRTPNKFALFVKENYAEVKKGNAQKTHAEIMKILGQLFNAEKNQTEKQ